VPSPSYCQHDIKWKQRRRSQARNEDRKDLVTAFCMSNPGPVTKTTTNLSQSRRLRHLQGITLRNLILVPAEKGTKGRAFDDEALPFSLKSPAKLLAIKEHKAFGHSRSHSDIKLKDKSDYVPSAPSSQSTETAKLSSPQRPTLGKTPRKSFMEPSLQGAKTRRDKLDDAIVRHIAEIFFTLHVPELKGMRICSFDDIRSYCKTQYILAKYRRQW